MQPTEPQPAHYHTRLPHLHIACIHLGLFHRSILTPFCCLLFITTVSQKSDSSADERYLTDSNFKITYPESFTDHPEKPVPFIRSPHICLTTDKLFFTQIKWIIFFTLFPVQHSDVRLKRLHHQFIVKKNLNLHCSPIHIHNKSNQ